MNKVLTLGLVAVFCLVTVSVFAADVTIDNKGSRLAVGWMDTGANGNNAPSTFGVADAKVKFNAAVEKDITGVLRLDLDGGAFNSVDYAYLKIDNVLGKIMSGNAPLNLSATAGKMKIDFGEETWTNNPVENALVMNSIADVSGVDAGLYLKAEDIVKNLPLTLNVGLGFMNGNGALDGNSTKAMNLKASGTMKSMPLYFSLSYYASGDLSTGAGAALVEDTAALGIMGQTGCYDAATNNEPWNRKAFELAVRYDLQKGAAKFTPEKAPLFSTDSQGVFRLAYGTVTDGEPVVGKITSGYVALDGIYNVNDKWYVAFRYSYNDVDFDRATKLGFTATTDPISGKWTRTSVGAGCRVSGNTTLKIDYSMNAEPDTSATNNPEIDNDTISVLLTTIW